MNYTDLYITDLSSIQNVTPKLSTLTNSKILITGGGGLIGSALIDFLLNLNDTTNAENKVFVAARHEEKIKERFRDRFTRYDFNFIKYNALKPLNFDVVFDYIIHAASPANPAAYVKQPVETMLANIIGINHLLDYARTHPVKRVLYISSSEVYGKKDNALPYGEEEYGFVDICNPRSCYPSSKRAAETLLASYRKEYGIDYVTVRPGHIYGPTATATDDRAATSFIRNVLNGSNIIMKSSGNQLRSYCYVLDCVSSIFTALLCGESGKVYNISNPESVVTIRQLAECIAECSGKKVVSDIPTEEEKQGYNFMNNSSLDSSSLIALGWEGMFDLKTGVMHTLEIMSK